MCNHIFRHHLTKALATIAIIFQCLAINIAVFGSCNTKHDQCTPSGKPYLWTQPQFQSASPELISAFYQQITTAHETDKANVFQAVLFGGHSTHNDNLTRYFTPFCKTIINVENVVGQNLDTDLLAQHFNIVTTEPFSSTVSFKLNQSTVALGLQYRRHFNFCSEQDRNWFFSISSPLTRIKNNIQIIEKITHNGGSPDKAASPSAVTSMADAFKQPAWKFGRIESSTWSCAPCPQIKTHFADIETKLGIEWANNADYHLETYTGVLIPAGNKPKGVHVFETIVGNGGHPGIMLGGVGNGILWRNEHHDHTVKLECALHSLYLFKARHVRSLDLKNKPFSRYMELYADKQQASEAASLAARADTLPAGSPEAQELYARATALATPGINILTLPIHSTPGFQFNTTTALHFTNAHGCHIEAGYNFFAQQAEHISLVCPWQSGPAIKSIEGAGKTNPARDITGNIFLNSIDGTKNSLDNYDNNMLTQKDLDLASASQPAGIAHTFYGSFGYQCERRSCPLMANLGGSYEFANASSALINRWTLWAKMGISF